MPPIRLWQPSSLKSYYHGQRHYCLFTFLTGKIFEDHVAGLHPNIKFSPFIGLHDKMRDEDARKWMSLPAGDEQEPFIVEKVLVGSMQDYHDTVQREARSFREKYGSSKPMIFLFDMMLFGHYPTLLGAPGIKPDANIGINTAPLVIDSNDTFPFRSGNLPHTGPDAKTVHWKARQEWYEEYFMKKANGFWWTKLRDMGVTKEPLPGLFHTMNAGPDLLLSQGVPEFELPCSDIMQDIRYFGAFKKVQNFEKGEPTLPTWWDDIAKANKEGKKIIAVSQGTIQTNPEDLTLPTIEALKDRDDVLLIASFVVMEPSDIPDLVFPENTRVAKFVPYDLLFPYVDILIANGGYGAIQHSLRLGIPIIIAGEGQDKAANGVIVQWTGVGINLGGRNPGAEKIGQAVDKIIKNSSFRKKAKTLSEQYHKYDVGRVFDEIVQEVVRDWNKKKMSSQK